MSDAPASTGVLLCGHGSRDREARLEFERFAASTRAALRARRLEGPVEGAFLEFSGPSIDEGLQRLLRSGADRIVAQPLMLFAARHARSDIPNAVKAFAAAHPNIGIACGAELPLDDALLAAAVERVRSIRAHAGRSSLSDTLLLVIGRGSSDAEANKVVAVLTLDLCRRLGAARGEFAFAGIAAPGIEQGLRDAIAHEPKRIVVFPHFLFTGVLVKRIRHLTEEAARRHPHIEFAMAQHLSDHPAVVATVADRIVEMAHDRR